MIMDTWCEIFHTTLIYEGAIPKDFVLLVHPHGVIPIVGNMIWAGTYWHGGHPDHFGGADVVLRFPFFRQWLLWMGGVSASKGAVVKAMRSKPGFSVFSGGIREMMETQNDREVLVLKSRVGIVRLAKENGKALVPVLAFGASQHFQRWPSPHSSSWVHKLSRKLKASLLLPLGRFGLPIPIFARTTIVFGEPIDTSVASVEELHAAYVQWFEDAYRRHRQAAGAADRELVIM